jgi:acyl dehydratase
MTAPQRTFERLADLAALEGQLIGTSDWTLVDQARIDRFAQATGDAQWIHVDPARAAAGPFGTTIAHGFLTLSLLSELVVSAFRIAETRMGLNYGLNRVRFPSPVPVGSRLRAECRLLKFEAIEGGAQLTIEMSVQREGGTKPACIAEWVTRHFI